MSEIVRDVTDATFDEEVIQRSRERPVLVDLWAPWCGPCRALTPVLERVAADANGAFELVKINIDENPQTAAALGARSIPLVIAFTNGEPAGSFMGAQPEGAVREFVARFVPSEIDLMVQDAHAAREQGRDGDAETILRAALDNDPRHEGARLALARLLGELDRRDEGLEVLAAADPSAEVDRLRSQLRVGGASAEDLPRLTAAAETGDLDAVITLAHALVAQDQAETALEHLLAAVADDPTAQDGAARQAMLDIFNVLGGDAPLVRTYRRKLAGALH